MGLQPPEHLLGNDALLFKASFAATLKESSCIDPTFMLSNVKDLSKYHI